MNKEQKWIDNNPVKWKLITMFVDAILFVLKVWASLSLLRLLEVISCLF